MAESETPEFVYGYGRTKHIYGWSETARNYFGRGYVVTHFGVCGAAGGYPTEEPGRPVCKHCQRAKRKVDDDRATPTPVAPATDTTGAGA